MRYSQDNNDSHLPIDDDDSHPHMRVRISNLTDGGLHDIMLEGWV